MPSTLKTNLFLEIAGLFKDYIVKITNGWIMVNGEKVDIDECNLPRSLLKYINSIGRIEEVYRSMDGIIYIYAVNGDGEKITISIEKISMEEKQ